MEHWIIGVAVGAAVAVLGALVVTYLEVRNVKGPRERAFVIRSSVPIWVGVGIFIAVVGYLPHPFPMLLYALLLPWLFVGGRKRHEIQARIRREEAQAGTHEKVQV
jgi:hypothetical protein